MGINSALARARRPVRRSLGEDGSLGEAGAHIYCRVFALFCYGLPYEALAK